MNWKCAKGEIYLKGIQQSLWNYFRESENFSLKEANDYILNELNKDVNLESIRARIYEGINKGLFSRLAKGVYQVNVKNKSCLLVNGDGRDLSFIKDNSIDAIITDHPYSLKKSHTGGNRNLAEYDCFQYVENDFNEKYRVLKPGGFLVEMLPSKNGDNWKYINKIHELAEESGLNFYAVVPWKKGEFIINQGRNSKNTEDIYFFSKGKARNLRLDAKTNKNIAMQNNLDITGLTSYEIASLLEKKGLEVKYMSGTNKMLPTEFNYQPPSIKSRIHQAEKPIELFEDIIEYVSLPNELLLDQYAGSGNLGIAALNKERDSILIEQNKETYDNMKAHIENYYENDDGYEL